MSTDTQRTDPQSLRANKLDLVEQLADDLAHEIKNPLHSMVINLEVLKRRIERSGVQAPEELLRYTGILGTELDRVSQRIELLLRLLRPARADQRATLLEVMDELQELIRFEHERRGLQYHFAPPTPAPHPLLPRDLVRQLLLNLLLGCMDLLGRGGSLDVDLSVHDAILHLRLRGAAPAGRALERPTEEPRLAVAQALGDLLGGELEVHPGPVTDGAASLDVSLKLPSAPV